MTGTSSGPPTNGWLAAEGLRLVDFAGRSLLAGGGVGYLDARGQLEKSRGQQTWITSRMVHVLSVASALGVAGARAQAEAALAGLNGGLRDTEQGGWFPALDSAGVPVVTEKGCYEHAFVLLAASSARVAGVPGAEDLLDRAGTVFLERFWEPATGLCLDRWDRHFGRCEDYRGLNANMHAVEAMLAAADATGDPAWLARAARIATFVTGLAAEHDGRLPEHFTADWRPIPDYNRDRPDDPFRPYGATVGHGLEWSRLLLQLEAALGPAAPSDLLSTARLLFDRAVTDGWARDGAPGFVYTTDWRGAPVVHQRMHWVAAEAVAAASVWQLRTGEQRFAELAGAWWRYIDDTLIDRRDGSWYHELDRHNRPAATVWDGKPDVYHAFQATLIPRLPLWPSMACAARDTLSPSRSR